MHYAPTHVVSVVTEDEDTGAQTTTATGVPVSIHRSGGNSGVSAGRFDGDKDTAVTVRAPHGTVVAEGDKLTDGTVWWLVDLVTENHNPVTGLDLVLQARTLT